MAPKKGNRDHSKSLSSNRKPQVSLNYRDGEEAVNCLDKCIKKGLTKAKFEERVAKHLQKTRGRTFPIEKIHNKLEYLVDNFGKEGIEDWTDIYRLGSECLNPSKNEDICPSTPDTKLEDIKSQMLLEAIGTPRQLRSVSRATETSTPARTIDWTKGVLLTPSERRRHASVARKKKDEEVHMKTAASSLNGISSFVENHSADIDRSVAPDDKMAASDFDSRTTISETVSLESKVPLSSRVYLDIDAKAPTQYSQPAPDFDGHDKIRDVKLEILQRENYDLAQKVNFLSRRARQAELQQNELKLACDRLQTASASLLKPGGQKELEIYLGNQKELTELRQCLDEKRWLETFSSATGLRQVDLRAIERDMESIGRKLGQILLDDDFSGTFDVPDLDQHEDLHDLVQRSLGLESFAVDFASELKALSLEISLRSLIQSLIAAAICAWAFEADLRDLFFISDNSGSGNQRLYDKVLDLIANQGNCNTEPDDIIELTNYRHETFELSRCRSTSGNHGRQVFPTFLAPTEG